MKVLWSEEEDRELLAMVESGSSYAEAALRLERSKGAVAGRVSLLRQREREEAGSRNGNGHLPAPEERTDAEPAPEPPPLNWTALLDAAAPVAHRWASLQRRLAVIGGVMRALEPLDLRERQYVLAFFALLNETQAPGAIQEEGQP